MELTRMSAKAAYRDAKAALQRGDIAQAARSIEKAVERQSPIDNHSWIVKG